jgi:hypothetical protein
MSKYTLSTLFYSITFCFLFFIISCSKDPAIPDSPSPTAVRKVLIETFTGHNDGHGVIVSDTFQQIQQRYPDKIIGITIHSGYFANVFAPPLNADFHCNEGDEYHAFSGVSFNPIGTVNRIGYPAKLLKDYTMQWSKLTDSMVHLPATVALKITGQYNSSTRTLSASVQCDFLSSLTGTYKLVVLLTEDIIAPQKDYTPTNPPIALQHLHHHILRDGLTSTWGDLLNTGLIAKGNSMIKNYSYNLPAKFNGLVPKENNCHVVAYIYNTATYEVVQADEMKMMN